MEAGVISDAEAGENFDLRSEMKTLCVERVIERLDAKAIARHEKFSARMIIDGEGEHSLEPIEQSAPPARVSQQKRLACRSSRANPCRLVPARNAR